MTPRSLHSTNYSDTFIQVADDCAAAVGVVPPDRAGKPTAAGLQYAMITSAPYGYTTDDVLFATSGVGRSLGSNATAKQRKEAREAFFSKGQACMRASALGKQFGWGVHADNEGRVAVYSIASKRYRELAQDPGTKQVKAMRSKRT